MLSMKTLVSFLLCAWVGLGGCSDEKINQPLVDLGAGDGPVVATACLAQCTKQAPYLCVKDASGACVECSNDAHCKKNPDALGASCVVASGVCACAGHDGCKDRASGQYCHASAKICGCVKDADCPASARCVGKLFGVGVCRKPCAANADCLDVDAPVCDSATGKCVACAADKDCEGALSWGSKCVVVAGAPACRCQTDAHCAGNLNGPKCNTTFNKCTCVSAADCKTAPQTTCARPYSGAAYKRCQEACASDADCGSGLRCSLTSGICGQCAGDGDCGLASASHCDTARALCVSCKLDDHCPAAAPHCHTASGKCTRCLSDTHCKDAPNWGNRCLSSTSYGKLCRCKTSTDCKGNPNGPTCTTKYAKCSCKSDADCKVSPYLLCHVPYTGASYKSCQKKCTSHNHCTSSDAPYCDATSGICLGCISDAHCASGASPVCDSKTGKCQKCTAEFVVKN